MLKFQSIQPIWVPKNARPDTPRLQPVRRLACLRMLWPGRRTLSWLLALTVGVAGTLLAQRTLSGLMEQTHVVAVLVTLSFLAVYLPVVRLLYHPGSPGEVMT